MTLVIMGFNLKLIHVLAPKSYPELSGRVWRVVSLVPLSHSQRPQPVSRIVLRSTTTGGQVVVLVVSLLYSPQNVYLRLLGV